MVMLVCHVTTTLQLFINPCGEWFCRSLPGNKITGGIPEQLGNLSSLTSLDLEDNLLVGEIPASLGHLTKLQLLYVSVFSLLNFMNVNQLTFPLTFMFLNQDTQSKQSKWVYSWYPGNHLKLDRHVSSKLVIQIPVVSVKTSLFS
jgi:hypothetical protein